MVSESENLRPAAQRLISLDAFRGITIAGMILVNNPGDWGNVYPPLLHASWHGWTPTDLIFPFFLFIVGVAMTFSLAKAGQEKDRRGLYLKILRRSAILFALGLMLAYVPKFDLAHIRIPGVLQRIALCYGIAAVLFLNTGLRGQIGATVAILLGYWGIMVLIPTPGYAAGDLTVEGNLAAHVDRFFLYGHLYKPTWDPEGLLSTLPAIATTLSGILAGHWLRSGESKETIAGWLFVGGWIAIVAGLFWGIAFPINKNLWTSSYVVFTAGAALQFLGFCYWLIDVQGIRRWAWPAIVYGSNAIAVFVLSGVLVRILIYTRLGEGETSVSLKTWLYQNLFLSWASPVNASLAFAVANVLFWLMIMAVFYRKKIFIKI